jgi:hypothetical protein
VGTLVVVAAVVVVAPVVDVVAPPPLPPGDVEAHPKARRASHGRGMTRARRAGEEVTREEGTPMSAPGGRSSVTDVEEGSALSS